jgi:hypothetical protein
MAFSNLDEDYWRMRCYGGLVHLNRKHTRFQDARCGTVSKVATPPGTIGPEAMVTCIQCLGSR